MPGEKPLVSCIMPTCNRQAFACQAIRYFFRQDYPNKELIIVDDSQERWGKCRLVDPRIRYLRLKKRTPLGEKRNIALAACSGDFVIHWDDDDWYASTRLTFQVEPLLRKRADVTGLHTEYLYDIGRDQFWRISKQLHSSMMAFDITCGTIAYRKRLWRDVKNFASVNISEDSMFLEDLATHGVRILKLPNRGTFIYIRHGLNTWRFRCGQYLDPAEWQIIETPKFVPEEDRHFYHGLLRLMSSPAIPASRR